MLCSDATETRRQCTTTGLWFVVPMVRIRNFHADVCLSISLSVWQCVFAPLFVLPVCLGQLFYSARLAAGARPPFPLPPAPAPCPCPLPLQRPVQAAIVLNFLTAIIIRQLAECSIMQLCEAAVTIFDCTRQTSNCH